MELLMAPRAREPPRRPAVGTGRETAVQCVALMLGQKPTLATRVAPAGNPSRNNVKQAEKKRKYDARSPCKQHMCSWESSGELRIFTDRSKGG